MKKLDRIKILFSDFLKLENKFAWLAASIVIKISNLQSRISSEKHI